MKAGRSFNYFNEDPTIHAPARLDRRIPSGIPIIYTSYMSLRCLFFRHRPMLTSILRRQTGYTALCDDCGLSIERSEHGRWTVSEALTSNRDLAA